MGSAAGSGTGVSSQFRNLRTCGTARHDRLGECEVDLFGAAARAHSGVDPEYRATTLEAFGSPAAPASSETAWKLPAPWVDGKATAVIGREIMETDELVLCKIASGRRRSFRATATARRIAGVAGGLRGRPTSALAGVGNRIAIRVAHGGDRRDSPAVGDYRSADVIAVRLATA